MRKTKIIEYLNKIRPYINLKSICEYYNDKNHSNSIDYNNLRVVLNGTSKTRLSEEKLNKFIDFLYKCLYANIFDVYNFERFIKKEYFENMVKKHCYEISQEIIGELNIEISDK